MEKTEKLMINELHTVGDFIRWGATQFNKSQIFFGHGTENAIDESVVLVCHALHLPPDISDILWHSRLTTIEKQAILDLFNQRIEQRIPTPYLTGEAWFAQMSFFVNKHVLIPRSPIAELIEQQFQPWVEPNEVEHVLDLCTGSGCIAIACAMRAFPNAEIDAVDISLEALEVADKNIENYGLEQRVQTIKSDLFSNLAGKRYDLIICNPPYVDPHELETMPAEYHHEPRLGLEAGEDGLLLVKEILKKAPDYLTDEGKLIVEVGVSQTQLVEQYPKVPFRWIEFQRGGLGVFLLTKEECNYISNSKDV